MTDTQRLDYIRMFIIDANDEVPIDTTFIDAGAWDEPQFVALAGEHHAAGFAAPVLAEGTFMQVVCADRISALSAELDEEDLEDYLRSLRVHIHLHVVHHLIPPPLDEVAVHEEQRGLSEPSYDSFIEISERAI